jgi:hypothetical protein
MLYLDDVSLPGHGNVSGAFWSQDRRILAVTSIFRLLTEPPARAAYGGQKLRYRVSLYRPPSRRPIAVFDDAVLPIKDLAFHPTKTVLALGAGSYDGGFFFKGQLVLWDWAESRSNSFRAIPEILRLRFTDGGDDIEAIVRPWDDGCGEGQVKAIDTFYRVSLKGVFTQKWDDRTERVVRDQIDGQKPLTGREAAVIPCFGQRTENPVEAIERAFGLDSFQQRSPIWDIALMDSDAVGIVHDDCLLDVFSRQGERRGSFKGRGHGVQLFRTHEPLVHVAHFDENAADWSTAYNTVLLKLHDAQLHEVVSLAGRYAFSRAQSGSVLGRCDRSFQTERESAEADVILSSDLREMTKHDFGHYDVFNHYIRVDAAPYLFFVQGTPPTSHGAKYLCTVTTSGRVERLWPLLRDTGDQASHAMECCFCYIHDHHGPGMIVSGRHYNSSPVAAYSGFIYRRNLDGRELWRHATKASAASIKVAPNSSLVMVAFLDGDFAVLQGDNGAITWWQAFRPDGDTSIIISLDVDNTHVAFGTIDGRCGVTPLYEFVREAFR